MIAKWYLQLMALMIAFVSCYEDKGNYDYEEKFEVEVSGLVSQYDRLSMVDSLFLQPQLLPAEREYDYFWGVYVNLGSGKTTPLDTISREKNLVYRVALMPGSYVLVFSATDRKTEIRHIKTMTLNVTTSLAEGWYILKNQDGRTDLDVHNKEGVAAGLLAAINAGNNLIGEARSLYYENYQYVVWDDEKNAFVRTKTLFAVSDRDAKAVDIYTGKIIHDWEDLFYIAPDARKPADIFSSTSSLGLVNDGKVATIYTAMTNGGKFGVPLSGSYRLSREKVAAPGGCIFFDELSSSFCTVADNSSAIVTITDKGSDTTQSYPPINHLDAELLFMGVCGPYARSAYALLKKPDQYLLMKLDASRYVRPGTTEIPNIALQCDVLDDDSGLVKADCWATNTDNPIIYFVREHKIYSCNVENNYEEKPEQLLPDQGEVTYIKHLKYSPYGHNKEAFDHLAVATYLNGKYRLYLYDIKAGHLQPDPKYLEGEGKVGKAMYLSVIRQAQTNLY